MINEVLATSKDAILKHVRHPEMEIRIAVGSCLSEILRIIAPAEPFEVEEMKVFFELVNKAFEHLPVMNGRTYRKSIAILKSVSHSHSFRLILDLNMYDLGREMFHLFLNGIRSEHSNEVCSNMEHIMSALLMECEDCDHLVIELTMILLSSLKKETHDAKPAAFNLAKKVFGNCADMVTFYILKATKCSGIPVEHYDDIVAAFCQDATQKGYMDLDEPENLSNLMPLESKPEDSPSLGKRIWKPNSLAKPEEGYEYFWMNSSCRRKEKRKRPAGEGEQSNSKNNIPKNLLGDITVTTLSPLSTNVSLNGEAQLGQVLDRQHGMKDMTATGELWNSQSGNIYQRRKSMGKTQFMEVSSSQHEERSARASDKHSSKRKEPSSKADKSTAEDLNGDILIKTLISKSRPSSSKQKTWPGNASNPEDKRENTPSEQEARRVSGDRGVELVGRRIKVWWPLEKMFFKGEITSFDPLTKKHQVDYDDGDREILELMQEHWLLLSEDNKPRATLSRIKW